MKRRTKYFLTSILSIVFTLVGVGVIYVVTDTDNHAHIPFQKTYSKEEVDSLVNEARYDSRKKLLDSIKNSLESGKTLVSVLKSLYPEHIVFSANSKYNFVPINNELSRNNYDIKSLQEDETTGRYSYVNNGQVESKFGIDVSSHQGDIDWEAVAADGVEFVFVRALYRGYGTGKLVVDEKCIENIEGAHAAGLDVGVYVFSQAITKEEIQEEASTVLNLLEGYTLELPIVFDVEKVSDSQARTNSLTVEDRTNFTIEFLNMVKSAGYEPMFYHNTEMGAMLLDLTKLTDYPKWFAGYTKEFYWPYEYNLWQYSESGRVNGIQGNVDMDIWLKK